MDSSDSDSEDDDFEESDAEIQVYEDEYWKIILGMRIKLTL